MSLTTLAFDHVLLICFYLTNLSILLGIRLQHYILADSNTSPASARTGMNAELVHACLLTRLLLVYMRTSPL